MGETLSGRSWQKVDDLLAESERSVSESGRFDESIRSFRN